MKNGKELREAQIGLLEELKNYSYDALCQLSINHIDALKLKFRLESASVEKIIDSNNLCAIVVEVKFPKQELPFSIAKSLYIEGVFVEESSSIDGFTMNHLGEVEDMHSDECFD